MSINIILWSVDLCVALYLSARCVIGIIKDDGKNRRVVIDYIFKMFVLWTLTSSYYEMFVKDKLA